MRFTYITSKSYPVSKSVSGADHIYVRDLAYAYTKTLGSNFSLIVRVAGKDVQGVNAIEYPQMFKFQTLTLFIFLSSFIFRGEHNKHDYLLSNDFNLIIVLGLLRILTRKKYKIVFDPHLLLRSWKDRIALGFSDLVITTSDELKRQINMYKKKNVFTVYGGVSLDRYKLLHTKSKEVLRRSSGLPVNKKLVGYIGGFSSMEHKKGLDTLISSLNSLPGHFHLVLAGGSGEQIASCVQYAKESGVEKRTHFLPRQKQDKLAEIQYLCDVLVVPYPDEPHFRDFGFPMKIFEYLATGNPIVYSKLKIIDDYMHGKGFSFTPGDSQDLARVILKAIKKDQDYRCNINNYTWRAKVEKNISLMLNLD